MPVRQYANGDSLISRPPLLLGGRMRSLEAPDGLIDGGRGDDKFLDE